MNSKPHSKVTAWVSLGVVLVPVAAFIVYWQLLSWDTFRCGAGSAPSAQVEQAVKAHLVAEEKVRELGGEVTVLGSGEKVGRRSLSCVGVSRIVITYKDKAAREAIKKYLGDTFFGVPYVFQDL